MSYPPSGYGPMGYGHGGHGYDGHGPHGYDHRMAPYGRAMEDAHYDPRSPPPMGGPPMDHFGQPAPGYGGGHYDYFPHQGGYPPQSAYPPGYGGPGPEGFPHGYPQGGYPPGASFPSGYPGAGFGDGFGPPGYGHPGDPSFQGGPGPGFPGYYGSTGYGAPGYGSGPGPGYGGFPPHGAPGYGPPGAHPRGRSPKRGEKRKDPRADVRGGRPGMPAKGAPLDKRPPPLKPATDAKGRLQQWLQQYPEWTALWLEGIDPPRRMASAPNVTMLMLVTSRKSKGDEFGFILASSRSSLKKKEREKECAKDLVMAIDALPLDDIRSWSQMPKAEEGKHDVSSEDLEHLTNVVRERCPNTNIDMPEPSTFVLVASMPWGPNDRPGADLDLPILDRFHPGFSELLKEARRVSGMVRKQFFIAVVVARPEVLKDDNRPITLGMGVAADRNLARARAVFTAELRAQVLTESMFQRPAPAETADARNEGAP